MKPTEMAASFRGFERVCLLPTIPSDVKREMVELMCQQGLRLISKILEHSGVTQFAVDIAVGIVDTTLKAGHPEILNHVLENVPMEWPTEVIVAFWATTAIVADQLPSRSDLWARFEQTLALSGLL